MKIFRILTIILTLLILSFGGLMFWKASKSHSTPAKVGLSNGQLKACGSKPNCVSSSADKNSKFYIAPFAADNIEAAWDNLNIMLPDMGFKMALNQDKYIHATAQTSLLKFVDDIEFHLDTANGLIHFRSQSRVGYSDMGANRKRIESIKNRLAQL